VEVAEQLHSPNFRIAVKHDAKKPREPDSLDRDLPNMSTSIIASQSLAPINEVAQVISSGPITYSLDKVIQCSCQNSDINPSKGIILQLQIATASGTYVTVDIRQFGMGSGQISYEVFRLSDYAGSSPGGFSGASAQLFVPNTVNVLASFQVVFISDTQSKVTVAAWADGGGGSASLNNPTLTGAIALTGNTTISAATATKSYGSTAVMEAEFINAADTDMWIYMRTGLTAGGGGGTDSTRSYLCWAKFDDSTQEWLMGKNESNYFILFDAAATTHRLWMPTGSNTYISSAGGSSSVIINGTADTTQGTGGLLVYSGGSGSNTELYALGPTGLYNYTGNQYCTSASGDAAVNIDCTAGNAANASIYLKSAGTIVWSLARHGSGGSPDFWLRNYNIAANAMVVKYATNQTTFGGAVTVPAPLTIGTNNVTFGATAPASGTWAQGDVCFNTGVTAITSPGWSCTVAGTPGTWTAWPIL
jgi:hypothetical protein